MENKEILSFLQKAPLFKDADPALLEKTLHSKSFRVQTAVAGERIGADACRLLFLVLEGRVQIRSTDGERGVILRTACKGEVLGAASLFLKQTPPLSYIEALDSCTVLLIESSAVLELMHADSGFLDAFLSFLAGRVRFLNQKIRCFTAGSAQRRLALWLVAEEREHITLPTSLSALAETLDIGRASLYRALDTLEAEGMICRHGREIQVVSRDRILEKYQ